MHRPAALALLVLVAGCVSTETISLTSASDRDRINARAERGHAMLAVAGERNRQVRDLCVGPYLTTWVDKKTGRARAAPTVDVRAVTFRRDGAGALKGAAVGLGIGVALGLFAGLTDDNESLIDISTGGYVGGFGAGGAVIGAIAGAAYSDRDVYRVAPAQASETAKSPEACKGPPLACAAPSGPPSGR